MNFHELLRRQRENQSLSVDEAAERLSLSTRAYQDREDNRADMNVPERFGLLVGLGMDIEHAMRAATEPDLYSFGSPDMAARMEKEADDPFVRETDNAFILIDRQHDFHEYPIPKTNVQTPREYFGLGRSPFREDLGFARSLGHVRRTRIKLLRFEDSSGRMTRHNHAMQLTAWPLRGKAEG